MQDDILNPGVCNAEKLSDNEDDSQTSGVDAEIAGVARVLYESLADMPIEEYKDRNGTSDEDNYKISNREESHNDKISSEYAYHPNFHPKSTAPSYQRVYNLLGGGWGCDYSQSFGREAQFIEFGFSTYGLKQDLK